MSEKTPSIDTTWLERRIERLERKVNILIDLLVANKTLDEKISKVFNETASEDTDKLLEWYMNRLKQKPKTEQ